ncbi:MAG: two-component regulator propeller domain-containing protein, partial [Planctomycetota bacterium]
MKLKLIIILTFLTVIITTPSWAQNHVLSLDGDGDYVEIEDSEALNNITSQVTMEMWIKATSFPNQWIPIIFKGDERTPPCSNRSYALFLTRSGFIQLDAAPEGQGAISLFSPSDLIKLNKWYHLAGVIDAKNGVMRIFINGIEVANRVFPKKEFHLSKLPLRIGLTHELTHHMAVLQGAFAGQIDEVRLWNVDRTEAQISLNMFKFLRQNEPGLVTYWQFEDVNEIISDVTGNGNDGKLIGDATTIVSELPTRSEIITGDELYQTYLSSLKLQLTVRRIKPGELSDTLLITARRVPQSSSVWATPQSGNFWSTPQIPVHIEIQDESSKLLAQMQIQTGKSVDWRVPDEVHGQVVIVARHSADSGKRDEAGFTCRAHSTIPVTKRVEHFQTYDVTDGLGGSIVTSMVQDRRGFLWFGLQGGGISRYDGRTFRTFTVEDGLPSNYVWTVFEDSKGNLWVGTGAGVCRYANPNGRLRLTDGETFQTYTTEDGLVSDAVLAICEDDSGHLWFGVPSGVSEFDGAIFRNYTAEDGLPHGGVGAITQDQEGCLWFGHGRKDFLAGNGATQYNGTSFRHFTTADGLVHNAVTSITTDTDGNLWFGTLGGVSKYDGKSFTNFTIKDGLLSNA